MVRYFLRLGFIAFGGPAAHIALMRRELVAERKWLTDAEFLDLLGVTNLIPGPNSTEMTMYLGAGRAGRWGLWLGGLAFIGPAVAIVLALAWVYVEYGTTPAAEGILFGVQPIVLAIIAQAIWGLRRAAVKGPVTLLAASAAAIMVALGANELAVLLGAGTAVLFVHLATRGRATRPWSGGAKRTRTALARLTRGLARVRFAALPLGPGLLPLLARPSPPGYTLWELFLVFLKIGGLLYGSGYVLVSLMEADLVANRGWLSEQQLLDGIGIGQFTPGPLFSSATFAGYLIDGWQGAAAATVGIFVPSFLFVGLTQPLVPKMRRAPWAAPFLDGVNAAAVALMAVVTFDLARGVTGDAFQAVLLAVAAIVLIRFSPNSAWLVLGGAAAGLAYHALT